MLLWASIATATTWVVAKDGTGDFGQVQLAIDVARAGDTIEVGPGTYVGALDLRNRPISIVGRDGSAATVIDGGGADVALTITGADVSISGITFVNDGAGIVTRDRSDVDFVDVVLSNLSSAFSMDNGAASFTDCTLSDNVGEKGAAIHAEAGEVSLSSSQLSGNRADRGADVYLGPSVRLSVRAVRFEGSEAQADGGSIYASPGAALVVANSVFDGSRAVRGGAIALRAASLSLSGSPVLAASADTGAGIWAEGSTLVTVAVSFSGGVAATGAGLFLAGGSWEDLGSGFDVGEADDAGAVYAEDALVVLSGTRVSASLAAGVGGVRLVRPVAGSELDAVVFDNNRGEVAALSVEGGEPVSLVALVAVDSDGDGASVRLAGDVEAWGISVSDSSPAAAVSVEGTAYVEGLAVRTAGTALWLRSGTLTLVGADLAGSTGAMTVAGGSLDARSLLVLGGDVVATGGELSLAHATLVGGGLRAEGGAVVGHSLVVEGPVSGDVDLTYSDVVGGPVGGDGNISADPLFLAWTGVSDGADLRLYRGSPCVDAGHPSVVDPDGTRADMGAFGGPDAVVTDADADGHDSASDCVDSDPTVFPGADDVVSDGVDQDCDGADAVRAAGVEGDTAAAAGAPSSSPPCGCEAGAAPLALGFAAAISRRASRLRRAPRRPRG